MKSISRWGAQHIKYSRIIIVLCHLLLVAQAIMLGLWTSAMQMETGTWITIGIGNIFFIAYLLYPWFKADRGFFKYSYLRQKALDFILVISYFLIIVGGVNQFVAPGLSGSESIVEARFIVYHHNPGKDTNQGSELTYKTKVKALKKQLRAELIQLKQTLKAKNDKGGVVIVKILLVLLSVGLALALAYLIAVLACGVACSGTEGLAWVILIVGWAGAIWLLVLALKAILRRRQITGSAAVS
jgi:hypothetical protein